MVPREKQSSPRGGPKNLRKGGGGGGGVACVTSQTGPQNRVPSPRPTLNKKWFPVHWPGGLKRAGWNFFFVILEKKFFFLNLLSTS